MKIAHDIREVSKEMAQFGPDIQALTKKNVYLSYLSLIFNWIAIILSVYAIFIFSGAISVIFFLIIGSRMRAMMNLIHDASHYNLSKNYQFNDFLADTFSAYFMLETTHNYRQDHLLHHKYLGTTKDPDIKRHGDQRLKKNHNNFLSLREFLKLTINLKSLIDSVFNQANENKEVKKIILYWILITVTLIALTNIFMTIKIMAIIFFSKIFFYHPIRIVAEHLDHTGLEKNGLISYTRTLPENNFLSLLLRPHSDQYHLLHHINPSIPHYHLKKAHHIFLKSKKYRNGNFYLAYFIGQKSLFKPWIS